MSDRAIARELNCLNIRTGRAGERLGATVKAEFQQQGSEFADKAA